MANSDIFLITQEPTTTNNEVVVVENVPENGYQFDAVTKHTATYNTMVTQHPIASTDGEFVSDHAIHRPFLWSMTGVLTPYNVVSVATVFSQLANDILLSGGIATGTGGVGSVLDSLKASTDTAVETVQRKRDQLIQFDRKHTILTIFGSDFQYPNMVITGISIPRTPDLSNAFRVAVKFQQIRIAPQAIGIGKLTSVDADRLGSQVAVEFSG